MIEERNTIMLQKIKIIKAAAYAFWRRRGGDLQDLISEAQLQFFKVYEEYNPKRSMSLKSWIYTGIMYKLEALFKKELRRKRCLGVRQELDNLTANMQDPERFAVLYSEMSDNAKTVIDVLCLEQPDEFFDLIRESDNAAKIRVRLKQYLVEYEGWDVERVSLAFNEITQVLSY